MPRTSLGIDRGTCAGAEGRDTRLRLPGGVGVAGDLFSLNVGGAAFMVPRRTLCAVDDSVLVLLADERLTIERDGVGAIFLDRSPELFAEILHYLRLRANCRGRKEASGEQEEMFDNSDEEAIMEQLTRTNWRHMSSERLQMLAAEANYYNLKSLELYLGLYCQRRWVECGMFVVSHKDIVDDGDGKKSSLNGMPFPGDAVLCLACDEATGVCAGGRRSGTIVVYHLPSLNRLASLRRHKDCVVAVVVTPRRIFSAGRDGFIEVGHSCEGSFASICRLHTHQGSAHDLLLLRGRCILLSCGEDCVINCWNLGHADRQHPTLGGAVTTPCPVRCLAAYHQHVFASCREQIVVLDLVRGELLSQRGRFHSAPIRSLAVNECAELLASGDWDGAVCIWDAKGAVASKFSETPKLAERYFVPVYTLAQCESWVAHVSFVGGLLAVSCGSVIKFFLCGPLPRVVRSIELSESGSEEAKNGGGCGLIRSFLAIERMNCLLIGEIGGTLSTLQNSLFVGGRGCNVDENSCHCGSCAL